ncbi:spore germination protein [Paenibacillus alvei TS-15]|jgi:spore germination protein KB|uniref:Spore germination protein n=1 Tax=Paenibacillus alvei TS-15 TaxID=1117108 RepID=S9SI12_PAEAL|nr:endospore germination permease [Paenibacillus alvei]EPY04369.1 spore germination protein [Paenibacillus alvei TS-15]
MKDQSIISIRQLTILTALFIIGSAILIIPSSLAEEARQDGWLSALLSLGLGLLVIPLYSALCRRYPGQSIAEYCELILGKVLGKAVSLCFIIGFALTTAALTLRDIGDFITMQIMPETPAVATHIVFMFIIIFGAYLGIEVFARGAEIFFPWVLLLFICFILFVMPQVEVKQFLPVLERGFVPVIRGGLTFFCFPFLDMAILLLILPSVKNQGKVANALLWGCIIGGAFLIITTLLSILALGAESTARHMYPTYALAKKISLGNFLERIEAVMAVIWFLTTYFRMALLLYATAVGLAQSLKLAEYRFLIIPLGMITVSWSILFIPNSSYLSKLLDHWATYALLPGLVLPLLLLLVDMYRSNAQAKTQQEEDAPQNESCKEQRFATTDESTSPDRGGGSDVPMDVAPAVLRPSSGRTSPPER